MGVLDDILNEEPEEQKPQEEQPEQQQEGGPHWQHQAYMRWLRERALAMRNDPEFDMSAADQRFSGTFNTRWARDLSVAVVGAGGLGNWQWRILMSMGVGRIFVVDDDTVGIENVGPQCHSVFDIGRFKADAVADAAMQYRGVRITPIIGRAGTMRDITELLGFVPDVVIGCTDSREWRNNLISDIYTRTWSPEQLPELVLDFRMSLGDWRCFVVPLRNAVSHGRLAEVARLWRDRGYLLEDEALQEPCTARAIGYTGANAASYTGAVLHWWLSGGRAELRESEGYRKFMGFGSSGGSGGGPIQWDTTFSARDFEFVSPTRIESRLRRKIECMTSEVEEARSMMAFVIGGFRRARDFVRVSSYEDLGNAYGRIVVGLEPGTAFMVLNAQERGRVVLVGVSAMGSGSRSRADFGVSRVFSVSLGRVLDAMSFRTERVDDALSFVAEKPFGTVFRDGGRWIVLRMADGAPRLVVVGEDGRVDESQKQDFLRPQEIAVSQVPEDVRRLLGIDVGRVEEAKSESYVPAVGDIVGMEGVPGIRFRVTSVDGDVVRAFELPDGPGCVLPRRRRIVRAEQGGEAPYAFKPGDIVNSTVTGSKMVVATWPTRVFGGDEYVDALDVEVDGSGGVYTTRCLCRTLELLRRREDVEVEFAFCDLMDGDIVWRPDERCSDRERLGVIRIVEDIGYDDENDQVEVMTLRNAADADDRLALTADDDWDERFVVIRVGGSGRW